MISAFGVLCSGTTAVGVTVAFDSQLIGIGVVGAATVRAAVSRDPNITTSALISPSSDGLNSNLIAVCGGGFVSEIPAVGIPSGERIYVACSAASTVVLYLQDNL